MRRDVSRNPSDPLEITANSQILSQPAWILGLNLRIIFQLSKFTQQIQKSVLHNDVINQSLCIQFNSML